MCGTSPADDMPPTRALGGPQLFNNFRCLLRDWLNSPKLLNGDPTGEVRREVEAFFRAASSEDFGIESLQKSMLDPHSSTTIVQTAVCQPQVTVATFALRK